MPSEVLAQDFEDVRHGYVPAVAHVEPLESIVQQVVGQLDTRVQHRRQEVGVVNLLVVVCHERVEDLPDLCIVHLVLWQLLPQLAEGDAALVLGVHLEKDVLHGRALLLTERPCHDLHAAAAEHRAVAEAAQSLYGHRVHLVDAPGMPPRDPGMLKGALCRQSFPWTHGEQGSDEVHPLFRDVLPPSGHDLELSLHGLRSIGERPVACEQHEDDNAEAPHVGLACARPSQHYFWGDVGPGAACASGHASLRGVPAPAEAEVDELQVLRLLGIVEDVLKLDVSMDDAVAVDVVQCQEDLPGNLRGLALRDSLLRLDAVEQLPPIQLLHHQVQGVVGLVDIV
mmetsp:Transcript_99096/g.258349  ORF Transcript_99096/g.258349 Transcript_99096/m.258349 type:complete len:340 (-) Transcript_99096:486-1505(-)